MWKQINAAAIVSLMVLCGGSFASAAEDAPAQTAAKKARLSVGDPAPPIDGLNWIKGEPVTGFQAGQVYVLDCWATWCGPCVRSIPELNDLHNQYKDKGVNVIGLAVWPRANMKPVKDFVEARGDKMAYRIAEDTKDGLIAKNYLSAARQDGIPCVFVIDQSSKVAWIGHPADGLEDVVAEVAKGGFDAKAFAKKKAEREEQSREAEDAFQTAMEGKNHEKVLAAADALLKLDAKKYKSVSVAKYLALAHLDRKADASALGDSIIADAGKDAMFLNFFAWTIVDPDGDLPADKRDAALAVRAATAAADATENKEPATLDTLARAYFVKGDIDKAIEIQAKATDLAEGDLKQQLQSSLEEYKTAKNKQPG